LRLGGAGFFNRLGGPRSPAYLGSNGDSRGRRRNRTDSHCIGLDYDDLAREIEDQGEERKEGERQENIEGKKRNKEERKRRKEK
jgi:hypothetical protein